MRANNKSKFKFLANPDWEEARKVFNIKFAANTYTFADFISLLEYPNYKEQIINILQNQENLSITPLQQKFLIYVYEAQIKEALQLREELLKENQNLGGELDIFSGQLISQQLDLVKTIINLIEQNSWDEILALENLSILEGFSFPSNYIAGSFGSTSSISTLILKAIENQAPLDVIIKLLEVGILYPNVSEVDENREVLEEHKAILEELKNPSLDTDNCKAVFDFLQKYKYEETVIDFTKHVSSSADKLEASEREQFLHGILTYVDFETYLKIYLAQYRYCANIAYEDNQKLNNTQKAVIKALVNCDFDFIENWQKKEIDLDEGIKSGIVSLMEARGRCLDAFSIPLEEAKEQEKFLDKDPNFNLYGIIDAEKKILNAEATTRDDPISIALIVKFTNPACEEIDVPSILNEKITYINLGDIYIKYECNSKLIADNLVLCLQTIFSPPIYRRTDAEKMLPTIEEIFKILFFNKKKENSKGNNLWDKIESLIEHLDTNVQKGKRSIWFFAYLIPNLSHEDVEDLKKDRDNILQYVKDIDNRPDLPLTFQNLKNLHSKLFSEEPFDSFFKKHFANKYPQYWNQIESLRDSSEYLDWLKNKVENNKYNLDSICKVYGNYNLDAMAADLRKSTTRVEFKHLINQDSIKSLWVTKNRQLPSYIKSFENYPFLFKVGALEPFVFTTAINYILQFLNVESNLRYTATAASLLCSTMFSALNYYGSNTSRERSYLDSLHNERELWIKGCKEAG
ncbi:MAG: hypothetical protein K0R73_1253 [Candidatus Midichloriaceae bacterium]|jgi:hypothetical protein|nr:hypothetical protein [Candidatus Midichloriaceae bacterium]